MSDMQPVRADITSIHLMRSAFMDAFAEIEAQVSAILAAAGIKASAEPFGNRLEKFRGVAASKLLAKANLGQRDQLCDKIAAILPIRADIVHSVFRPCILDGIPAVRIVNAQNDSDPYPVYRVLTERNLYDLAEQARQISKKLAGLKINPAPSPPQPSPDAAGGP